MLPPSLKQGLAEAQRPMIGMWCSSASPLVAEICAGSGIDFVVIDCEHSPTGLTELLSITQAVAPYPVVPVARIPTADAVVIKQYLDLGVQSLLVPMIESAVEARGMAAAVSYPPHGIRGVGSALARASRWGRVPGYLSTARETVTMIVQVESAQAVHNLREIAAVEGIDAVFIGPADLAASMGHLGRPDHPEVVQTVDDCIATANEAKVPVGVNTFDPALARHYIASGADFVVVSADVYILARGAERLISDFT